MGFEGLDGALGGIVAMEVGGHKLVGAVPFGDDSAAFYAGLIVKDLAASLSNTATINSSASDIT